MPSAPSLTKALKAEASRLGFASCGITRADSHDGRGALGTWLEAGHHGTMEWMEARADQRAAPQALWPEARSVIALGMSYAPREDPMRLADATGIGRISVYAQGADYHDVVKRNLKTLARWLVERAGGIARLVRLTPPDWRITSAALAAVGSVRTRLVVLNSPLNPTGSVASAAATVNSLVFDAGMKRSSGAIAISSRPSASATTRP